MLVGLIVSVQRASEEVAHQEFRSLLPWVIDIYNLARAYHLRSEIGSAAEIDALSLRHSGCLLLEKVCGEGGLIDVARVWTRCGAAWKKSGCAERASECFEHTLRLQEAAGGWATLSLLYSSSELSEHAQNVWDSMVGQAGGMWTSGVEGVDLERVLLRNLGDLLPRVPHEASSYSAILASVGRHELLLHRAERSMKYLEKALEVAYSGTGEISIANPTKENNNGFIQSLLLALASATLEGAGDKIGKAGLAPVDATAASLLSRVKSQLKAAAAIGESSGGIAGGLDRGGLLSPLASLISLRVALLEGKYADAVSAFMVILSFAPSHSLAQKSLPSTTRIPSQTPYFSAMPPPSQGQTGQASGFLFGGEGSPCTLLDIVATALSFFAGGHNNNQLLPQQSLHSLFSSAWNAGWGHMEEVVELCAQACSVGCLSVEERADSDDGGGSSGGKKLISVALETLSRVRGVWGNEQSGNFLLKFSQEKKSGSSMEGEEVTQKSLTLPLTSPNQSLLCSPPTSETISLIVTRILGMLQAAGQASTSWETGVWLGEQALSLSKLFLEQTATAYCHAWLAQHCIQRYVFRVSHLSVVFNGRVPPLLPLTLMHTHAHSHFPPSTQ